MHRYDAFHIKTNDPNLTLGSFDFPEHFFFANSSQCSNEKNIIRLQLGIYRGRRGGEYFQFANNSDFLATNLKSRTWEMVKFEINLFLQFCRKLKKNQNLPTSKIWKI